MASLTPAVLSTETGTAVCRQALEGGQAWVLECVWLLWLSPGLQPVQGGPAWAGGKPSGRQFSPQPALRVCLHPINVALALVLILGLWVGTQLLCNLARQECGGM